MTAKEFLNRAYLIEKEIDSDVRELEEMKMLSETVSAVRYDKEVVQSSRIISDNMAETVAKITDMQEVLENEISRYIDIKSEIRDAIMMVEDNAERMLLKYRFLHFYSWEKIAAEMDYSVPQIYRIRKRAFRNFEKLRKMIVNDIER